jgi:hypothetical protein
MRYYLGVIDLILDLIYKIINEVHIDPIIFVFDRHGTIGPSQLMPLQHITVL